MHILFFSWDEFDQMRKDMISESRKAWQKFDEEMQRMESKSFNKSLNISSDSKTESHENSAVPKPQSPTPPPPPPPPMKESQSTLKTVHIESGTGNSSKFEETEVKPRKDEEIKIIRENDKKNDNIEEISRSWFTPMKLVRFPSLFGDDLKIREERSSLFKEENVIKVIMKTKMSYFDL